MSTSSLLNKPITDAVASHFFLRFNNGKSFPLNRNLQEEYGFDPAMRRGYAELYAEWGRKVLGVQKRKWRVRVPTADAANCQTITRIARLIRAKIWSALTKDDKKVLDGIEDVIRLETDLPFDWMTKWDKEFGWPLAKLKNLNDDYEKVVLSRIGRTMDVPLAKAGKANSFQKVANLMIALLERK